MKVYLKSLCALMAMLIILSTVSVLAVSAETYFVESDIKFTRSESGDITVCGYVGSDTHVTIPKTLSGYSVESIGDYAFLNNTSITGITIPTCVKNIGQGAFYGCVSLKSISLPVNCINLGPYLFYGCTTLTDVSLSSVTVDIPRFCFSHCTYLQEIKLPSTVKTIGEYAFADCLNLKKVYIPKYVTSINSTAFDGSPYVVIYGYLNTYAHTYAQENNIAFCALDGDAATYTVTYYNYDGSIYWLTSVEEGEIAMMPSKNPEKPSTDTHYYEFHHWDGNIANVQQNEHVYPVFTEIAYETEEPDDSVETATYYVVFLDSDGTFISAQTVKEGDAATAPEAPKRESDAQYTYTFSGWDTTFDEITADTIVRAQYKNTLNTYTVTFSGFNGATLDEQIVEYGVSATAPQAPEVEGYTFSGWDTDYSCITADTTVTAQYTKNVSAVTTGKLTVEVISGAGFTISVDGGAARPQGSSYMNTKMAIGSSVTVVASTTAGNEFLGWLNSNTGAIVSTTETYTFVATGNDMIKALYRTSVDGANLVIFKNDKAAAGNGQIIDMQYYASTDSISFPEAPSQGGYDFAGWNMTEAEIQAALANGEDVTVLATWTVRLVYVTITVNNGSVTTNGGTNDAGQYLAYKGTTVVADAAADGMKFAYWVDGNGNVMSYKAEYKFYPTEDIELTAVYVAEDETVSEQALVAIVADNSTDGDRITWIMSWYVPKEVGTFVAGGVLLVETKNYNESTFVVGTTDSNVTQSAPTSAQFADQVGYGVNKGKSYVGTTWYGCTWVQYTDAVTGETVTVYSDILEATKH